MDNQALIAIAAQIPLVAAFFTALQRGWIYIGRTIVDERQAHKDALAEKDRTHKDALDEKDRVIAELRVIQQNAKEEMRSDFQRQIVETANHAAQEREDRIAADERTAKMADSLREATEVMRSSVELHERATLGVAQNAPRPRRSTRG